MGIDHFKDLYVDDEDFTDIYKVCVEYKNHFYSSYAKYTLQSDILFKGNQLCVPRGSIRENFRQEIIMDLWVDILGSLRPKILFQGFTIGLEWILILGGMWKVVLYVKKLRALLQILVFTNHYQSLLGHENF